MMSVVQMATHGRSRIFPVTLGRVIRRLRTTDQNIAASNVQLQKMKKVG